MDQLNNSSSISSSNTNNNNNAASSTSKLDLNNLTDFNLNTTALDLVKELKSNGTFDQFRKDCFLEIISQPAYQSLKKNVEEFTHKFLKDQKWSSTLKKNELRDDLRKKLNECYFLNDGIDPIVNEIIDPKIELIFKPLIDSMVDSTFSITSTKSTTSDVNSSSTIPSGANQLPITSNVVSNSSQESKTLKQNQQKVSVEDFLFSDKPQLNAQKLEKSKSITEIDSSSKQLKPTTTNKIETDKPHEKIIKKSTSVVENANTKTTSTIKKPVKLQTQSKPKDNNNNNTLNNTSTNSNPSTNTTNTTTATTTTTTTNKVSITSTNNSINNSSSNSELTKISTNTSEPLLDADPKKEYNFDWLLDSTLDSNLYEDVSVSSVHTSDLSDYSEYNEIQDDQLIQVNIKEEKENNEQINTKI